MRIEVNLLPGAKRGKRKVSGGSSVDFQKLGAAIAAKFRDFYLALAVGSWAVTLVVVGLLFMMQRSKSANQCLLPSAKLTKVSLSQMPCFRMRSMDCLMDTSKPVCCALIKMPIEPVSVNPLKRATLRPTASSIQTSGTFKFKAV